MRLVPAPTAQGIVFRRTDVTDNGDGRNLIVALYDNIADTRLGMTLANGAGVSVATVEHLMAALYGCGIDNVTVELSGPEVPAMDGSAAPFVFLLDCAGQRKLNLRREALRVVKPIAVRDGERYAELRPADRFTVEIEIDYETALLRRQRYQAEITEAEFRAHLSRARTFGFLHDIESLRKSGRALGGSLENAVVIDGDAVLNSEGMRFGDECVRHKALDAIGDLALAGVPLLAHFRGFRSGHALNAALLQELFATKDAFERVRLDRDEEDEADEVGLVAMGLPATA